MRFYSPFPVHLLLLTVFVGVVYSQPSHAQVSIAGERLPKRLVGDYGYWSKFSRPPYSAAQIPFQKLTHVNHAGVSFAAGGTLAVPDGFIEPELINLAHANGVKVILLAGGDFPGVENSGSISVLVENLVAFATQYHYDGIDLDWEFPATTADRRFFVQLMARLRAANSAYILSIDVPPWGGYGYDLIHLQTSLNFLNVMMYECAGPWPAYGQLNSPIFWDHHDPAPWEHQPGGQRRGGRQHKLFPGCPAEEARAIAMHTSVRGSGRVGRTFAGRALEEDALTAAVIAAARHRHTPYDRLLMRGYSRGEARNAIRDALDRVLESWRCQASCGNS